MHNENTRRKTKGTEKIYIFKVIVVENFAMVGPIKQIQETQKTKQGEYPKLYT